MLCTVVFFIHPWLGRPAGGTINCSAEIMVLKAQWKTKFSLPRTTSCEVTQVTDKIYLLMVWQQICWLFSCLCFIKQTNKHIIVIPWAVKAVTVGKAPPLSLQPTTQEWAGCLQWSGPPPHPIWKYKKDIHNLLSLIWLIVNIQPTPL